MLNKKRKFSGHRISGYLAVLAVCCLSIGIYVQAYALNLDKIKIAFMQGDYKAAISGGEKLIAQNPNSDELYYILGISYLKDGNYLRASDIFEIILKEFKNSRFKEEAELGLGDTYFLRDDLSSAKNYYQELLDSNPKIKFKAQILYRLSLIANKNGSLQEAKGYLDKISQDFPLNLETKYNKESLSPAPSGDIYYTVQVGSFADVTNAKNLAEQLIQKGFPAYTEEASFKGKVTYRVKVGKSSLREEIVNMENKLSHEGYPTKICP